MSHFFTVAEKELEFTLLLNFNFEKKNTSMKEFYLESVQ